MNEQPENNRPSIPIWVWILGVFALILGVQLWMNGRFQGPEQISLPQTMTHIKEGDVESIEITGDTIRITLNNGTELATTMDSASSLEETLSYFGVTKEILEENNVVLIINDQSTWNTIFPRSITTSTAAAPR